MIAKLSRTGLFLFAALSSLFFTLAYAHHSTSHYAAEISELEGTLIDIHWRNPHVYLFLETQAEDGSKTEWELEAGTLYNISRTGITANLFNVGDKIRVAGHKSDSYEGKFWLENVLAANGKEYIFVARSSPRCCLLYTSPSPRDRG